MISKTNKKNAKNKDQAETEIASTAKYGKRRRMVSKRWMEITSPPYYYDYDEDGDIFYYRKDGTEKVSGPARRRRGSGKKTT